MHVLSLQTPSSSNGHRGTIGLILLTHVRDLKDLSQVLIAVNIAALNRSKMDFSEQTFALALSSGSSTVE